jgi:quercetin dioxygenase-like cupin family protein
MTRASGLATPGGVATLALATTLGVLLMTDKVPVATADAASAPTQIVRKDLLTATIAGGKEVSRVEIKQIDFQPGQRTGLHRHPIPVVGYIARGTIQFQVEGGAMQTLHAGDPFFEPANTRILHFDNPSTSEPVTFIAYYMLGKDDQKIIEMLE